MWRLLDHGPGSPRWNMAVDEVLMESSVNHNAPPTLRLYAWDPACLSLGYAQNYVEVDEIALSARGWDLVRRPTGGRAILHTDEITYSVSGPLDYPTFRGSILESYKRIASALVNSLTILGVCVDMQEKKNSTIPSGASDAVCFEVASNYEITLDGKKLIGSAQSRRSGGFLQHGSLPLHGELDRIISIFIYQTSEAREIARLRLLQHATTLENAIHRLVAWQQASDAFIKGFQEALQIKLIPSELDSRELKRAEELLVDKYGNEKWNHRL